MQADQAVPLAVPPAHVSTSVQAAPPRVIRHPHPARPKASAPVSSALARLTYVAQPRTVVHVSPARRLLATHRTAVISKLAPTAPLVKARVLAAAVAPRPLAQPKSSTAKTIAALAAGLSKK